MEELSLSVECDVTVQIPYLFEIWNWVGDTSVLPTKWYEVLKKSNDEYNNVTKAQLADISKSSAFVPDQFFFLTTRSEATCCVLLCHREDTEPCLELTYLAVTAAHRATDEVWEAIIALSIQYAWQHGVRKLVVKPKTEWYANVLKNFNFR